MDPRPKADPAMYPKLRDHAFRMPHPAVPDGNVTIALMDWRVSNGMCTVMASADGSASLYLSSGGGFLGGGQAHSAIRDAAVAAVAVAQTQIHYFALTESTGLPGPGDVYFYLVTNAGILHASALDACLADGSDRLLPLAAAMQNIVTQYRLKFSRPQNTAVQ